MLQGCKYHFCALMYYLLLSLFLILPKDVLKLISAVCRVLICCSVNQSIVYGPKAGRWSWTGF